MIGCYKLSKQIFAAVILTLLLFSACVSPADDDTGEADVENLPKIEDPDLEKARALWKSKNIADYDMEIKAELPENKIWVRHVLIRVRGGKQTFINSAKPDQTGSLAGWDGLDTVENLFDAIQQGRNAGITGGKVTYNKEYGYPEKVYPAQGGVFTIEKFEIVREK